MAPGGPPRAPKSSLSSSRTSRGGIQKRKSGPTKVDKDGDLMMDAASTTGAERKGKGRPEGSSKPTKGRATTRQPANSGPVRGGLNSIRTQQAIIRGMGSHMTGLESRVIGGTGGRSRGCNNQSEYTYLSIRGLRQSKAAANPDGGVSALLGFLERKGSGLDASSKRGVQIKKSRREGEAVIITVTAEDASKLLKLNGFTFAGSPLIIEECNEPATSATGKKDELSDEAKDTKERIRGILSSRYDTNLKLLNLSSLGLDPVLIQMGIFDDKKRITKLFAALMAVCDSIFTTPEQKREAVVSVTLANNDLENVSTVTSLSPTFPDIHNLDLSGNKIADLRALEAWRPRFRNLQNLKLTGNPIETLTPNYHRDIIKWFPNLLVLNDVQVRTPEEVLAAAEAAKQAANGISPIPISGPDYRDVNQIGENFARQFFPLYDSDRSALGSAFYDLRSVHSLSVNVSAPRTESEGTLPSWSKYIRHSRNFIKLNHVPARMSRAHQGVDAIRTFWAELPATRHPDLSTDMTKYLIDCHPLSGLADPTGQNPRGVDGLILMVHGEFEDTDDDRVINKRSFSRTFVLGPGGPDGPAIRVVSDIMVLRAWSPLTTAISAAAPPSQTQEDSDSRIKQEMVAQLSNHTRLTLEFAVLCLKTSDWDLEKAFAAYQANKSALPAEAFLN